MSGKTCDKCSTPFKGFGTTCGTCRKGGKVGGAPKDCEKCGSFFVGHGAVCTECLSGKGLGRTGVRAPTPEEVDSCLERIEACIRKVDASQQSMVRLRKAEFDLLGQLEIVRDIIQRILKSGDRVLLKNTFVDCGRVARLSAFMDAIHLSQMNKGDQRFKDCGDVVADLRYKVENDMGMAEQLAEAAESAQTGMLMKRLSFLMDAEKVASHQQEVDTMYSAPPTGKPEENSSTAVGAGTSTHTAPAPLAPAAAPAAAAAASSGGGGGGYPGGGGSGSRDDYHGGYSNYSGYYGGGYYSVSGYPEELMSAYDDDVEDFSDWEDEDLEEMTEEQADLLLRSNARILFEELDVNKDGALSKEEVMNGAASLSGLLRACRIRKRKDVIRMFKEGDIDNNGTLDFAEFITYLQTARKKAMAVQPKQIDDRKVMKVFALMDRDGDGALSCDELKLAYAGVLLMAGEVVDLDRISKWTDRNFKKYDTDNSGALDIQEFKVMLARSGALAPMLDLADCL